MGCWIMTSGGNPRYSGRRKFLKLSASAVGAAGLAGCLGDDEEAEEFEFTIASPAPPEDYSSQIAIEFGENVEERTDERITVEGQYGTLGGEEDIIEALVAGSVDMTMNTYGVMAQQFSREHGFLGCPFVIHDREHFEFMKDEFVFGEERGLDGALREDPGLTILGTVFRGNRSVFSNTPVRGPEDFEGLSLRVIQADPWIEVFEELGAEPTGIAFDELFSSLETGVVDAGEANVSFFFFLSFDEVTTHFSLTEHKPSHILYQANLAWWDDLIEEDQEIIQESLDDAFDWGLDQLDEQEEEEFERLEDDPDFTLVRDVDRERIYEAADPAVRRLFDDLWIGSYDEVVADYPNTII